MCGGTWPTGRFEEAEDNYRKALAIQRALADEFPAVHDYRRFLARTYAWFGDHLRDTARYEDADQAYRQAIALIVHHYSLHKRLTTETWYELQRRTRESLAELDPEILGFALHGFGQRRIEILSELAGTELPTARGLPNG